MRAVGVSRQNRPPVSPLVLENASFVVGDAVDAVLQPAVEPRPLPRLRARYPRLPPVAESRAHQFAPPRRTCAWVIVTGPALKTGKVALTVDSATALPVPLGESPVSAALVDGTAPVARLSCTATAIVSVKRSGSLALAMRIADTSRLPPSRPVLRPAPRAKIIDGKGAAHESRPGRCVGLAIGKLDGLGARPLRQRAAGGMGVLAAVAVPARLTPRPRICASDGIRAAKEVAVGPLKGEAAVSGA